TSAAHFPSMKWRSEWHSPAATVRISTSRGPGSRTWTSSMTSAPGISSRTAAFTTSPPSRSRLGGGLEVRQRLGHAFLGDRLHAVEVLRHIHSGHELGEELVVVLEHLPALGDLGAAVDRPERVAPPDELGVALHAEVRERELDAPIGDVDPTLRLPRAIGR